MPDNNLIKLKEETYMKMIRNSPGTRLFNSLIVKNVQTDAIFDILENGIYSGAFFVSSLLSLVQLIDQPHATVTSLKEKMLEAGFTQVGEGDYEVGDILAYEEVTFDDGTKSDQVGIYLGQEKAVSTSYKERKVIEHHFTFGETDGIPSRKIVAAYRPDFKNNEILFEEKGESNGNN